HTESWCESPIVTTSAGCLGGVCAHTSSHAEPWLTHAEPCGPGGICRRNQLRILCRHPDIQITDIRESALNPSNDFVEKVQRLPKESAAGPSTCQSPTRPHRQLPRKGTAS